MRNNRNNKDLISLLKLAVGVSLFYRILRNFLVDKKSPDFCFYLSISTILPLISSDTTEFRSTNFSVS